MRVKISLALFISAMILLSISGAWAAAAKWPGGIDMSFGAASPANARWQFSGEGYGTIVHGLTLKVGGWVVNGSEGTRGFLSNAYACWDRPTYYIAGGQKFVVFGPAGLLVSPGARGGEIILKGTPITLQLLGGRTQFTPITGNAGRTTPNLDPLSAEHRLKRDFFAARAEYDLTRDGQHVFIGLNGLWMLSRAGASLDAELPVGKDQLLYGEIASFDGDSAELGGIRFTDFRKHLGTKRETTLDVIWKNVANEFAPGRYSATQYINGQSGISAGLSQKLSDVSSIGLYGDSQGVLLNFSRHYAFSQ